MKLDLTFRNIFLFFSRPPFFENENLRKSPSSEESFFYLLQTKRLVNDRILEQQKFSSLARAMERQRKKSLTSAAKPFEAKVMSTPLGATIGAKEVVFHRNNISPDLQPYYEARHSLEKLPSPTVPCFQSLMRKNRREKGSTLLVTY